MRYCGFRGVLVDDSWYKKRILHIFGPFLAVSGRFGNNLKQPYFIAHFNEQFDCFNDLLKALLLFPRSHRSLLPLILPSRQRIRQLYRLTMKLRYFPDFFAVLRYLPIFFAVMRCLATPNVPLRVVGESADIDRKLATGSTEFIFGKDLAPISSA